MSDSNIIRADGNGWYYIYDDLDRLIESGLGIKVYNDNTVLDGLANGCDIKTFLYNASPERVLLLFPNDFASTI